MFQKTNFDANHNLCQTTGNHLACCRPFRSRSRRGRSCPRKISPAEQRSNDVKSNGRNKKYGQLKHDQEISFPLQRICLSLCPFLLAIHGQRVFHSNGWINPRPDVMQKKQPGPCIIYGGTEAKRCFCNYMDVSKIVVPPNHPF